MALRTQPSENKKLLREILNSRMFRVLFFASIAISVLRALSLAVFRTSGGIVFYIALSSVVVVAMLILIFRFTLRHIRRSHQDHKWLRLSLPALLVASLITVYSVRVVHMGLGPTLVILPLFIAPLLFMLSMDL